MVDGLIRFARAKFGNPEMSVEEITERLVAAKVFDLPPAGRFGTPEDLAVVVCTLASPRSGFITGANYRVDGGQVRSLN
jgi:NAD(P)-dependent dehydrogenase (short-subunit alcohol dehydrogenase family)